MDLKEFASLATRTRALKMGRSVDGVELSPDEITQTVANLDVPTDGEEVHQAFTLTPPTLQRPDEIVVTVMEAPQANFKQAVATLTSLDRAHINVAPALVISGLQNKIHTDTTIREAARFIAGQATAEDVRTLMPAEVMNFPTEDYIWGDDYIIFNEAVTSKPVSKELVEKNGEVLEDSTLPATLADNPTGELHGRHIVIIKAAPEVIQDNPALNPASTETSSSQLPVQPGDTGNAPAVEVMPGTQFVPKRADFTWADPNGNDQVS